jgi:DnaJ-class molecular chaperone
VEETLTIEVMPGWKAGTRVVFPGKGNSKAGVLPSDVVLVIEEKPHEVLRREGHDLVIVMKVPLVDALTGYTAPVETLDGRLLMVPCVDVLKPSSEVIVKHEGMPICSSSSTITSSSSSSIAHDLHSDSPTAIATIAASDRHDKSGKHQHGIKPLRGDLRLHFHIVFPDQLSAAQKAAVRHALIDLK